MSGLRNLMNPEASKLGKAATESWFAIVPAAGIGSRLGLAVPKQYLNLGDRSILQWTVDALCQTSWIRSVLVVVAPDDTTAEIQMRDRKRVRVVKVGGQTRRDSVHNALSCLGPASADDWVLVQDAARPGITLELLNHLKLSIEGDEVGGLLAIPVADTVKRQSPNEGATAAAKRSLQRSASTVDRRGLWLAQTPQVFRLGLLRKALDQCPDATDEASAIESLGFTPQLVLGARENFKVTTMEDYLLMQRLITGRAAPPDREVQP